MSFSARKETSFTSPCSSRRFCMRSKALRDSCAVIGRWICTFMLWITGDPITVMTRSGPPDLKRSFATSVSSMSAKRESFPLRKRPFFLQWSSRPRAPLMSRRKKVRWWKPLPSFFSFTPSALPKKFCSRKTACSSAVDVCPLRQRYTCSRRRCSTLFSGISSSNRFHLFSAYRARGAPTPPCADAVWCR